MEDNNKKNIRLKLIAEAKRDYVKKHGEPPPKRFRRCTKVHTPEVLYDVTNPDQIVTYEEVQDPEKNNESPPYSIELAEKICFAVATNGECLKHICRKHPEFPKSNTIQQWKLTHPEFFDMYMRAKITQCEVFEDQLIEIADYGRIDEANAKGNMIFKKENYKRSMMRIKARQWILKKRIPWMYGEKIQHDVKGTITHEQALKELE